MEEDLLTNSDILRILEEAKEPIYSQPNLSHFGREKTSIIQVSKDTGLIFINGNQWTGIEHINNRHSPMSRISYWNKQDEIGNPSKFDLNLAPIEYIVVADKIFSPDNLNNSKNNNQEIFDVFVGKVKYKNSPEIEYTLVVYKKTKIVHTMYVSWNKKPFNKKRILDLRQGWMNSSHNYKTGIETFEMSYYDSREVARFKVILRSNKHKGCDKWYVQVNQIDGTAILTTLLRENNLKTYIETPFRTIQLDFSNITWIEIKKMIDGNFEY